MKIQLRPHPRVPSALYASTLVEIVTGVALLALMGTALFGGMSMSVSQTRLSREELRATQIMVERMEGIRLFNWNQLLYSNSLCPSTFTTSFYPLGDSTGNTGITYYGTVVITNVNFTPAPSYSANMRAIIVGVTWTNLGAPHSRSMMTYQTQYGMQNYIFSN